MQRQLSLSTLNKLVSQTFPVGKKCNEKDLTHTENRAESHTLDLAGPL